MHQRTNWTTGASASAGVLSLSRNFPKKKEKPSTTAPPPPPATSSVAQAVAVLDATFRMTLAGAPESSEGPPGKLSGKLFRQNFPIFSSFFEPGGLSPALKAGRHPAIEHPVTDASEPRPPPLAPKRSDEMVSPCGRSQIEVPSLQPPPTPPRHPLPSTAPSVVSASRPAPRGSPPLRVPHADARVGVLIFFF